MLRADVRGYGEAPVEDYTYLVGDCDPIVARVKSKLARFSTDYSATPGDCFDQVTYDEVKAWRAWWKLTDLQGTSLASEPGALTGYFEAALDKALGGTAPAKGGFPWLVLLAAGLLFRK